LRVPVEFRAPRFNTFVFLTFKVLKDGQERFRDPRTSYQVVGGVDFQSEFNGQARMFK
jgi:hypothetical protein